MHKHMGDLELTTTLDIRDLAQAGFVSEAVKFAVKFED